EIAEKVRYSDLHLSLWKNQEAIAMVLLADLPGNLPRGVYDLQFQCFGKDWVYPAALTLN
ncbi:MAG: hypothetical protein IKQ24_03220, partial [Verrucomicrobia bacterium]|nr:hypothetical protein [Verrucomicrobiota bacterium]